MDLNVKLNIIIPKICEQSGKYRSGGSSYIHFLRVKNIRFPFLFLQVSCLENIYF